MTLDNPTNQLSPSVTSDENDEVAIREVFKTAKGWITYLLSKWLLIFLASLVGGVIGFGYAFFKKPVYAASSTFVLEESSAGASGGGLGQYSGLASMVGLDMNQGGGIFQGDNLLELYKSRKMIEKTLLTNVDSLGKKKLLIDIYIDDNEWREKWKNKPKLKNISFQYNSTKPFDRIQDSLLREFTKDINKNYLAVSKPDKKLNLIKVEVRSTDEFFSKEFNDHIVSNVNDFYLQTKTKKSLNNLQILQHQTDSIRNELNGAISSVASRLDANPNLNPSRTHLRAPSQKRGIDVEVNKAILTQLITNMELAKVTLRKEAPLIQLIDGPIFPLEKERIGKIKAFVIGAFAFGFIITLLLLFRHIVLNILG